jgi:hypothetical protein
MNHKESCPQHPDYIKWIAERTPSGVIDLGDGECNCRSKRHGSPIFYELLEKMSEIHSKKSHDYASNNDPYANYKFAGMMSKLFDNPDDAGFIGRIGEKLYRLANLENNSKNPSNESVEDTELDIAVIVLLWISMRQDRRLKDIIE